MHYIYVWLFNHYWAAFAAAPPWQVTPASQVSPPAAQNTIQQYKPPSYQEAAEQLPDHLKDLMRE